jgi:hypothetical protein
METVITVRHANGLVSEHVIPNFNEMTPAQKEMLLNTLTWQVLKPKPPYETVWTNRS